MSTDQAAKKLPVHVLKCGGYLKEPSKDGLLLGLVNYDQVRYFEDFPPSNENLKSEFPPTFFTTATHPKSNIDTKNDGF